MTEDGAPRHNVHVTPRRSHQLGHGTASNSRFRKCKHISDICSGSARHIYADPWKNVLCVVLRLTEYQGTQEYVEEMASRMEYKEGWRPPWSMKREYTLVLLLSLFSSRRRLEVVCSVPATENGLTAGSYGEGG